MSADERPMLLTLQGLGVSNFQKKCDATFEYALATYINYQKPCFLFKNINLTWLTSMKSQKATF